MQKGLEQFIYARVGTGVHDDGAGQLPMLKNFETFFSTLGSVRCVSFWGVGWGTLSALVLVKAFSPTYRDTAVDEALDLGYVLYATSS